MSVPRECNSFLQALDGVNPQDVNELLGRLGAEVAREEIPHFEEALRQKLQKGKIDITNWQNAAIRTLLIVLSQKNITVNLIRGGRMISPLSFPESKEFLDYFVNEVIISEPW